MNRAYAGWASFAALALAWAAVVAGAFPAVFGGLRGVIVREWP